MIWTQCILTIQCCWSGHWHLDENNTSRFKCYNNCVDIVTFVYMNMLRSVNWYCNFNDRGEVTIWWFILWLLWHLEYYNICSILWLFWKNKKLQYTTWYCNIRKIVENDVGEMHRYVENTIIESKSDKKIFDRCLVTEVHHTTTNKAYLHCFFSCDAF